MLDSLRLNPVVTQYGCGVYEVGDTAECYVKLFVTDYGFVIPVNHRILTPEDLMSAYVAGRREAERKAELHSVIADAAEALSCFCDPNGDVCGEGCPLA